MPNATQLPEVALDWPLLLHVERAGALAAIVSCLLVVGWRASRGELPTRFANIEYRVDGSAASIKDLEERVVWLEFQLELRDSKNLEGGPDDT